MQNGFSFQDAAVILKTPGSSALIDKIMMQLEEGSLLSELMIQYCPKEYRAWYEGFSVYMPFLESMTVTVTLSEQEEMQHKKLLKGILYPVSLMIMMFAGIAAFARFILPSMISLMNGFGMENHGLLILQKIIICVTAVISLLLLLSAGLVAWSVQKKHIVAVYKYISRHFPDSFPVKYASCEFTRFFLECCRVNVSTRESIAMLSQLENRPLTSFIAAQLDHAFMNGMTMEEAVNTEYVEKALSRFLCIAVYASDSVRMMEGYLKMCDERTAAWIRKFSSTVQIVSYSCTGLVLVLIYRIMLMPMEMIQNL